MKRPADEPADDEGRGDAQGDNDDGMIGSVLPYECTHRSRMFASRIITLGHLYQSHDDNGGSAEKKGRDHLLRENGNMTTTPMSSFVCTNTTVFCPSIETPCFSGMEEMGAPELTRPPCPSSS